MRQIAVALAVSAAPFLPWSAFAADNLAIVDQSGSSNIASQLQELGSNSVAQIEQSGGSNNALQYQSSQDSDMTARQSGSGSTVQQYQYYWTSPPSGGNSMTATQGAGSGNYIRQRQVSNGSNAEAYQIGTGNQIWQEQIRNIDITIRSSSVAVQEGNSNFFRTRQDGSVDSVANSTQTGDLNDARIDQPDGTNLSANVVQTGSLNDSLTTQSTQFTIDMNNASTHTQTGVGNFAMTNQN
jgi:cysteine synthase